METNRMMLKRAHYAIGILVCFFLSGCKSPPPLPADFKALATMVGSPQFTLQQERYPYTFRLQYRPDWYQAGRDLKTLMEKGSLDPEEIKRVLEPYSGAHTFVLVVDAHPDVPSQERKNADIINAQPDLPSFSANLHRLFFEIRDKIYILTSGKDRIPLSYHYVDRNWGMGTANSFLLSFPSRFNDVVLSEEESFEVVIQNLTPSLAEIRFEFKPNPIKLGHFEGEELARILGKSEGRDSGGGE